MSRKRHPLYKEDEGSSRKPSWNCPLPGGGTLTVYLRDAWRPCRNALGRPLVLVVPGGGYNHVSAREGDPVALQFAAAGYHTAVLTTL